MNGFHPGLKFTRSISDEQPPFLDLVLKPATDRLVTGIHWKPTDTHSQLNYASSHPNRRKEAIPYSQFLRLRRICSVETAFTLKKRAKKWLFFSDAVATRNGLLIKPAIELWPPTIR